MINKDEIVPDKTIAVFISDVEEDVRLRIDNILSPSPKKRDWFNPHFYMCLPLVIGNTYGFILKSEFPFAFEWDGGDHPSSVKMFFPDNINNLYPRIETHFGHGIITINPPFTLRTPPGVNLMTINPPNFVVPNITVMSGVIETDNLRRNFTFNLKIQTPNVRVEIPAGTPIAGFIPIPRYFADGFKLELSENIFSKETCDEEFEAINKAIEYRKNIEPNLPNEIGRHYFKGQDVYGNKFQDHQKP